MPVCCLTLAMGRVRLGLVLAALTVASPGCVQAGSLNTVWEFDLRKALQGRGGAHSPELPVWSVTFSPDGSRLAVAADQWLAGTRTIRAPNYDGNRRVFVIQTGSPAEGARWYDLPDESGVEWSSGGTLLKAAGSVIRLADDRRCEIPLKGAKDSGRSMAAYEFAADLMIGQPGRLLGSGLFGFFGGDCALQGAWTVPGWWSLAGASPDRRTLLVQSRMSGAGETAIADPVARKVLQRWPNVDSWEGWTVQLMVGAVFADSGKAICGGSEAETKKLPVSCWDVDTGRKIADAPGVRGGVPITAAQHASRVVVSDYRRVKESLFSYEYGEKFKRVVVWDFRTGEEILSWNPRSQS